MINEKKCKYDQERFKNLNQCINIFKEDYKMAREDGVNDIEDSILRSEIESLEALLDLLCGYDQGLALTRLINALRLHPELYVNNFFKSE